MTGEPWLPHAVARNVPPPSHPYTPLPPLKKRSNSHARKRGNGDVGTAHNGPSVGDLGRGDDGGGGAKGWDRGEAGGAVGNDGGSVGLGQVDGLGERLRGGAGDGGHGLAAGTTRSAWDARSAGGNTLRGLGDREQRQEEGRKDGGELHLDGGGVFVWCWYRG